MSTAPSLFVVKILPPAHHLFSGAKSGVCSGVPPVFLPENTLNVELSDTVSVRCWFLSLLMVNTYGVVKSQFTLQLTQLS